MIYSVKVLTLSINIEAGFPRGITGYSVFKIFQGYEVRLTRTTREQPTLFLISIETDA